MEAQSTICPYPPLLSPSWQDRMDQLTGSRELPAESVEILYEQNRAYQVWKETLLKAEKSIRLYTYYLRAKGPVGKELVSLLEKKARQGLTVRIIAARYAQMACDPRAVHRLRKAGAEVLLVGNISPPFFGFSRKRKRHRLVAPLPEGIHRKERRTATGILIDFSLHIKTLLVDHTTALVGGRNINDNYFTSWEDTDLFITGPVAAELTRRFDIEFSLFSGGDGTKEEIPAPREREKLPGLRCIISNPWEQSYETLAALIHAVRAAEKSIHIVTQYVIPPRALLEALEAAARRGVDIHIITNSRASGKAVAGGLCWYLSSNWYGALLRQGIHIHEWKGLEKLTYLHTKLFLVDRRWLAIGSFNLSVRSAYLESEILCALYENPHIEEAGNLLDDYLNRGSTEVTLEDLRRTSLSTRIITKAALFFRLYY
ncbi:MAG: phosphatidylserine/phosphatidylglycerophosphate/cardiolipin synthase family protein [Spirochaetales bacterium]|nr:phosphatidylserine/phosphatidylglycerophosphate/cardiolipin synthase family protein [Spirochaetales bacterium]